MIDKRQFQRIPVSFQVRYPCAGDLARDLVTDLSSGGLFIRTSRPLPIGTELELELHLGQDGVVMKVQGRVAWLKDRAHGADGMGIAFVGPLDPALAQAIARAKAPSSPR